MHALPLIVRLVCVGIRTHPPTCSDWGSQPTLLWWGEGGWVERSEAELHVVGWSTFMSNNPSLRPHLLGVCGRTGLQSFRQQQHERLLTSPKPPDPPLLPAPLSVTIAFPLNHLDSPSSSYSRTPVSKLRPKPFSSPLSRHLPSSCHPWSSTITLPSPSSRHHRQPDKPT